MNKAIKKGLVPKFRFKEFSGEWDVKKVSDVASIVSGYPFHSELFTTVGKKLVIPKNFTKNGYGNFSNEYLKFTSEDCDEKYICRSGDLLLLLTDLTQNCELLGKPLLLKNEDSEVLLNQRIIRIETVKCNKVFLMNFFLTENYHKKIKELATGSTVKHSSNKIISNIDLILPTPPEQTKIAACLSSLDDLITAQTQKIEALKTHKKGLMQQLFPQEGETVPKLRFPEFRDSGDWVQKTIDKWLTIGNGKDYKHLSKGNVPVYGTGGYMLSVDDYLYDGESVCIGRKGTINNPMFLNGKFWTVDTLFYTHSFKGCLPKFIYLIFQNINWLNHNEAGGVPSLSKTNIGKIEIAVPSEEEQQKIADCLSSLDDLINAHVKKCELLKIHKKGLMQGLFPSSNE
jgi:type I restriction enzyme S subunit